MLSIVDLSPNRKRLFERLRKHNINVTRIDLPAAEPVFLIKADPVYTDPQRLRSIIKRYGKALFVGGDVPEELSDICFHAQELPLRMLVKTAADYYSLRSKKERSIVLSVIDKSACACDEVSELCSFVRCVRVVTSKIGIYENVAQSVYENCGAGLMVSGSVFTAQNSDVIISADDSVLKDIDFGRAVVYRKNTCLPRVYEVNRSFASCDDENLRGIICDRFTLLCALYEECGRKIGRIPVFLCPDAFKEQQRLDFL